MRAREVIIKITVLIALLLFVYLAGYQAAHAQTCTNSGDVPVWSSTTKWTCAPPATVPLPTGNAVNMTIANASATGTTVNRLAKLTGAPSKAVITATTDTENAIGVCTANCGTTGNATIAIIGQVTCDFDNATTAGNYVTISAITAGKCHDAGSAFPNATAAYGRVLTTNGASGAFVMELMTPDIAFQNAGNGKSKPGGLNTEFQYNNSGVFAGTSGITYVAGGTPRLVMSGSVLETPQATFNGAIVITTNLTVPAGSTANFSGSDVLFKNNSITPSFAFLAGGTPNGELNAAANKCWSWTGTVDNAAQTATDTALCRNAAGVIEFSTNAETPNSSGTSLAKAYKTDTNCADSAGAAACGSASAGSVVIDAGATTVVVSTTAVTANSQIFVQYDSSLSTRLSVTCNATVALPVVTARTAATSFTITVPVAPVTNPACYSFFVIN